MPSSADRNTAFTTNGGPFDACLSGLTPRQSQRVRELAHRALAGHGLETAVHEHHLEALDGRSFGLDGIASVCHGNPEAEWPSLIGGHFAGLMAAFPGDLPPELTAEEIRAKVHARLVLLDGLGAEAGTRYTYAPRIGGGFAEVLAHKDGDFVRWLSDEDVAKVGADELFVLGRERLRLIRPDVVEILRRDGGEIYVARGNSGFIASKLLLLPEVLRIVLGRKVRYPDGVLVAVPSRHELVFAPLKSDAAPTLAALVDYSALTFNDGLRPLSPHVYWWRAGQLTPLTSIDRTGRVSFEASAEFIDTLGRLSSSPAA